MAASMTGCRAMAERPILFSAPMVRALLDGRKTQTRRIVKPAPVNIVPFVGRHDRPTGEFGLCLTHDRVINKHVRCPYGVPGDLLWVKETYRLELGAGKPSQAEGYLVHYEADGAPNPEHEWGVRARPSIHMPRWASRIALRITDVRVERLSEVSAEDAFAEGIRFTLERDKAGGGRSGWGVEGVVQGAGPQHAYSLLWEHINGPGSWDANPWVWAVSFERVGG